MTVREFLRALENKDAKVSIRDYDTGNEIVNIKAGGYANLDDTLETTAIEQIKIENSGSLEIKIKEEVDSTPDTPSTGGDGTSTGDGTTNG